MIFPHPGRSIPDQAGAGGAQLPFIPPAQSYDGQASPAAVGRNQMSSQHHSASSRVEHRRNPDGSMSISIGSRGGGSAGGSSFGGETRLPSNEEQSSMNISDVSHLLLNSDNGEGDVDVDGESQGSNSVEKIDE